MKKGLINSTLIHEEQRSAVLFISLFYSISIAFDLVYYYIIPRFVDNEAPGFPEDGFGYWIYIFLFGLLPVAIYFIKNEKPNPIKYIYFIAYTILTILNDIFIYAGNNQISYKSGNAVEVFFILFSPIFVNSRFFNLVTIGLIIRYCIAGVVIQTAVVFLPIAVLTVLSIVSFILLNRFQGYVKSISKAYDQQIEKIVKGIIATLELKDSYTRGHSERVAKYASILAAETNQFSKEELKSFNYACLLHDVGKINIPDCILLKPSRLTDEEYEIIKIHPVVGAEVVKGVEGLTGVIDVILYHHERWDGKGYPEQLKGEEIPLLARITAIADAFDAMTSSRSYRKALPLKEAYSRVIEGKGTQFDPELVNIFQKIFPKWVEVYNNYPWNDQSSNSKYNELQSYYSKREVRP
ncbi:HD-GYP domain-containing protein [Bacillus sp. FJAT-47783]|uniref:HD-GYP domain-containing protein n=1 Tax=Bacillus sp. FJAT-47783 TaxID=2922712 RepID=UPI001FAC63A4|nr:HD-GYP domain-containing protein [Bacillus sp. FJAT-47783]